MRVLRVFVNSLSFMREVVREYRNDNGNLVAAAVAFYLFVSLAPLLLLAVATLGYLLGSPDRAKDIVFVYLREYAPALGPEVRLKLEGVIEEIILGRGAATGFGIIFLIWSGSSLMSNLERAVNVAWDVERRRSFLVSRLLSVGMLAVVGMLFILSFAATATIDAVKSADLYVLGMSPSDWPWLWNFLAYLVPLIVTIIAFTATYKFLPNACVPLRSAIAGGLFAGVLWEVAKVGFSIYLSSYATYGAVYGSLTGIVVLMIWINYSAVVAILGAEASSIWAKHHASLPAGQN